MFNIDIKIAHFNNMIKFVEMYENTQNSTVVIAVSVI